VASAVDLVRGRVPESCHVSVGCGGALLLRDTARVTVVAVTGGQGAAKEPGPAPARRPLGAETQLPSLDALLLGVPVRQAV
jgi:hypothetical protein